MPSEITATVFCAVLLAALLHAAWNAVVKGACDPRFATVLVAGSAAVISCVGLLIATPPAPASWPYIAGSGVIHLAYFALVARAYRDTDMGVTYPLMRGTAPFLVAIAGAVLGESLSRGAWIGVALISTGIVAMIADKWRGNIAGIAVALTNAAVIAAYTLIDGHGVRLAGEPFAYTLWVFAVSGFLYGATVARPLIAPALSVGTRPLLLCLIGGAATLAAYCIVLWAMTRAPVAVVAALRETSILFATVIAAFVLKERMTTAQCIAVAIIATGAMALKLA